MDLFARCRQGDPFKPLSPLPFVRLDLRYACERNLCARDLYGGEREAWLHQEAWEGLCQAGLRLRQLSPAWRFRIYDATRPVSVQVQLFAQVMGTPQQAYVADPAQGSAHNYGFALDLGLEDEAGRELDLGTAFDSFDPLAQPQLEQAFFAQGQLSGEVLELRQQLAWTMLAGGYQQHPLEWWHFDQRPLAQLKGHYPRLDT